jgi:hypothetical protein
MQNQSHIQTKSLNKTQIQPSTVNRNHPTNLSFKQSYYNLNINKTNQH